MTELTIELIEVVRGILHGFCPYENSIRYKLLEDLRAIETRAQRPTGKHCIMNMTYEERKVAEEAIAAYHARCEYSVIKENNNE